MSVENADIIDLLAGLGPSDALSAIRDKRPAARANAQLSFEALLEPEEPGPFTLAERYAVATYVSALHGFAQAEAFYADLLGDEAPELTAPVAAASAASATEGPYGAYREASLHAESTDGLRWTPDAPLAEALGRRLSAALAHAHLLVFRPRESDAAALSALESAGFTPDEVVTLSQLISFLTFQLRLAYGLRVLHAAGSEGA